MRYTYEDFKTPEDEMLDFGTVSINGEPEKTLGIRLQNPVIDLPEEDCVVYINSDYERTLTIPDRAYCIALEKASLNNFKVTSTDIKSIAANSGSYLIFIGDYYIAFAKTVYTINKEVRLDRLNTVSTEAYRPSVRIGSTLLKVKGDKVNAFNVETDYEGIYLFDSEYEHGYTQLGQKPFIEAAVVNGRVVYKGQENEKAAIPGTDGYLLCFYGESVIGAADEIEVGQEASDNYLKIKKSSLFTVTIGDKEIGINALNSTRYAGMTVLFTPDNGFGSTKTNEWGYEYTVSGGVVTAITEPAQENSGNAVIPEDGFVISTLMETPEYRVLRNVKIGDRVEIKAAQNIYVAETAPYHAHNTARPAEQVILYDTNYGRSTRTNEWGYEIIVDKDGRIIGDSGDGNAAIPEGGFVLSGPRTPFFRLTELYKPDASVYLDKDAMTFTVVYTPMDEFAFSLKRLELIKGGAENAYSQLMDIDHKAVGDLIKELEQAAERAGSAAPSDLTAARSTVIEGIRQLYNLIIPSVAVEDRGAWHVLSEKNEEQVRQTVESAVSLGLNYIIIDTWANGYAYYHSELDDVLIHPNFIDFDPLEAFVRIGHEYGLKVHSSFSVFMAGGRKGNYPEDHPTQREGWVTLSRTGYNYCINGDGEFYTLDPHNPEVREYVIKVFREVAERYDVDGIHYDYIRFPQPHPDTGDFGYNDGLKEAFQEKHGTNVDPVSITESHSLWEEWCRFRCDVISSFVKECTIEVKKIDSSILVTAAVFAGMEEMTTSIFQDARSWVEGGYIDGLFPMLYTPSISSFDKYGKRAIAATADKAYLSMGLGTFEFYTVDTILQEAQYARRNNAGICFFTLDSVINKYYNVYVREGIFKREAVTTDSEEAFSVAVNDLIRRIDDIYIPFSDGFDDKLNELKALLSETDENGIDQAREYAQENLGGVVLDRVSESLDFIEYLTIKKGFSLDIK